MSSGLSTLTVAFDLRHCPAKSDARKQNEVVISLVHFRHVEWKLAEGFMRSVTGQDENLRRID